ncbi:hypothetical protein [Rhodococcus aetherivorans]|uniref:hypothetical protein n=1 Tax=Rhodococcus aetherivorans TaxID=191292 RepID=UPI001E39DA89|nr:hypothetical protein [Rhodococcus aetherivorans]UGQ40743.1 hypothetical protein LRQ66_21740 [Rhodococcus aetherivorans]
MKPPPTWGDRLHAVAMGGVAGGVAAYWLDYFTAGHVRSSDDAAYIAFENAFPAADGLMAASFATSAWHLTRGRAVAIPLGIAAGGAMTFLGAMDTLWNLEHGSYRHMTADMAVETGINIISLVFGPWTVARLWRRREALAG